MLCYNLYQAAVPNRYTYSDMGCDEELFFVLYSKEWIILSHGFHRKHVQAGGPDFSGIESSGKIRFIYDGTSAEIEEDSTGFHFPKSVCVHDIFRVLIERSVDGENISLGKQSVEIYLPVAFLSVST